MPKIVPGVAISQVRPLFMTGLYVPSIGLKCNMLSELCFANFIPSLIHVEACHRRTIAVQCSSLLERHHGRGTQTDELTQPFGTTRVRCTQWVKFTFP